MNQGPDVMLHAHHGEVNIRVLAAHRHILVHLFLHQFYGTKLYILCVCNSDSSDYSINIVQNVQQNVWLMFS